MQAARGRELEGNKVYPVSDLVGSSKPGGEILGFSAEVQVAGREPYHRRGTIVSVVGTCGPTVGLTVKLERNLDAETANGQ